jgi:hypothetical protein
VVSEDVLVPSQAERLAMDPAPVARPQSFEPKVLLHKTQGKDGKKLFKFYWGDMQRLVLGKGAKDELGLIRTSHNSLRFHFDIGPIWGRRQDQVLIQRLDPDKAEVQLTNLTKEKVTVLVHDAVGNTQPKTLGKNEAVLLHEGDAFIIGDGKEAQNTKGPYYPAQITFHEPK